MKSPSYFLIIASSLGFISANSLALAAKLEQIDFGNVTGTQTVNHQSIAAGLDFFDIAITTDENFLTLRSDLLKRHEARAMRNEILEILSASSLSSTNDILVFTEDSGNVLGHRFNVGKRLYVGNFVNQELAIEVKDLLSTHGLKLEQIPLSYRPQTNGNFQIHLLKLAPSIYKGSVISVLAHSESKKLDTVSNIALQNNAIAATNGGFFTFSDGQGTIGDPAGISIINGELVSESVVGRPALIIRNKPDLAFQISSIQTSIRVRTGEVDISLNGINRLPGNIFNCGYINSNGEVVPAIHDIVCHSENEAIVYTSTYGHLDEIDFSKYSLIWINNEGIVYIPTQSPLTVPVGHRALLLSRSQHKQLIELAVPGANFEISFSAVDEIGNQLLTDGTYVVNGGPTLLKSRLPQIHNWELEGWSPNDQEFGSVGIDMRDGIGLSRTTNRASFFDNWVNKRHPRTFAGVDINGIFYLGVVYGRQASSSIGLSVPETLQLAQSLGLTDAINLDGGGSSAMFLRGVLTGTPSDKTGERSVGDAILFLSENGN